MIYFDTFTKNAYECGRFGKIYCCQRLLKAAKSPINCPIWSHWFTLIKVSFHWNFLLYILFCFYSDIQTPLCNPIDALKVTRNESESTRILNEFFYVVQRKHSKQNWWLRLITVLLGPNPINNFYTFRLAAQMFQPIRMLKN